MTEKVKISEDFHQLAVRQNIREGAELSTAYLLMNTLAATIASYGLFANSPAVVIGAMIVAMLLGPIAGIALALVDSDMRFLWKSTLSLVAGALVVMVTAFIIGVIHKNIPITHEIMARTEPNLLDLMVALAGGAACAYATVSPRLSVAFVGVAIATALVPPLSAASILLARGEVHLALGAVLLTFTNMVAIQFSSSVVLWCTGFREISHTSGLSLLTFIKRNAASMTILAVLAFVLTSSLERVVAKRLYETSTRFMLEKEINASAGSYLVDVRFDESQSDKLIVRAVVRGPNPPSGPQVAAIEAKLPEPPDHTPVELRIRFVQTKIINREGELHRDTEFGADE